MRWTTVFWDLDGTLIDPWEGITGAVRYAVAALGHPPLDDAALARFIGPPLLDSFHHATGWDEARCRVAVDYYRVYFRREGIRQQHLYPGIAGLVRDLAGQGVRQVVATSKPTPFAEEIVAGHLLRPYLAEVVGSELDGRRAAKRQVLQAAVDMLGNVDLSRAVMIGDTAADVEAAHAVGCDSVAVRYGYGHWEEMQRQRPTVTVETVAELAHLLIRPPVM